MFTGFSLLCVVYDTVGVVEQVRNLGLGNVGVRPIFRCFIFFSRGLLVDIIFEVWETLPVTCATRTHPHTQLKTTAIPSPPRTFDRQVCVVHIHRGLAKAATMDWLVRGQPLLHTLETLPPAHLGRRAAEWAASSDIPGFGGGGLQVTFNTKPHTAVSCVLFVFLCTHPIAYHVCAVRKGFDRPTAVRQALRTSIRNPGTRILYRLGSCF